MDDKTKRTVIESIASSMRNVSEGVSVYTGSTEDYAEPSLHKIGTGEGNLVYGYGLYGSTNRDVAEFYAENGSLRHANSIRYVYRQTFFTNRDEGGREPCSRLVRPPSKEMRDMIKERLDKEHARGGRTYSYIREADLDDMWRDARRSGEIPASTPNPGCNPDGENWYRALWFDLGGAKEASEFLARAGIDGIKYPVDSFGGKRIKDGDKAGWNYVSFRDDNIRIDRKWVDGSEVPV